MKVREFLEKCLNEIPVLIYNNEGVLIEGGASSNNFESNYSNIEFFDIEYNSLLLYLE